MSWGISRKIYRISCLAKMLAGFLFLFIGNLNAQNVKGSVDRNEIKIGEEIIYSFEVEADTSEFVLFPDNQVFLPLEIIESYKADTTFSDAKYKLIKKYGLTQFDTGHYTIPSQRIVINNRSFFTDSIPVEVKDVVVDTLKQKMFDIKPPVEVGSPGLDVKKILWWVIPILFVLALLALIRNRRKKAAAEKPLPPYEEAIVALKNLDNSELLKQNKSKEYYSSLTEIVKRYLDREVDDNALESTSDELIQRLMMHKQAGNFDFDVETIRRLDKIFKRADLVKFARMSQDSNQAQVDRKSIEDIINETNEIIPEPVEEDLAENQEYLEKLRKKKQRKLWTYRIAGVVGIILAAGLIYGGIKGFDNLKDLVFGNELKQLSEQRWIKSEYGTPAISIETPEVLTRAETEGSESHNLFTYGEMKDKLFISISTVKFPKEQHPELATALENALMELELNGAKNMIVKRDEFETDKGITGVRAHGEFNLLVSENRVLKNASQYELVVFAQENGLQQVLVVYQDDGRFAEEIKNRIFQSVELEVIKSYGQ